MLLLLLGVMPFRLPPFLLMVMMMLLMIIPRPSFRPTNLAGNATTTTTTTTTPTAVLLPLKLQPQQSLLQCKKGGNT